MKVTVIYTHDGPVLVTNPAGTASYPTPDAAERELRRLKGLQGRPEGSPLITHRHTEIQVRSA